MASSVIDSSRRMTHKKLDPLYMLGSPRVDPNSPRGIAERTYAEERVLCWTDSTINKLARVFLSYRQCEGHLLTCAGYGSGHFQEELTDRQVAEMFTRLYGKGGAQ